MKKLAILLLLPFFFSCSSDDDEITPPDNNVELIYNEPLVSMFGKTLEDVKKAETRDIVTADRYLLYKESKNGIGYQIYYRTNKEGKVNEMACRFDQLNFKNTLNLELSKKYKKNDEVSFISADKSYGIYVLGREEYSDVIYSNAVN